MKRCLKCGNQMNDNVNFYPFCGSSNLQPQFQEENPFNEFQQTDPALSNSNYGYPTPIIPQKPKKNKIGIILAIIAASTFSFLFFLGLGIVFFADENADDIGTNIDSGNYVPTVAYTKGTFDGTTYTNEWANLKFTFPLDFEKGNEDIYSSFENEITECGMYAVSPSGSSITIAFEKLPAIPKIDEKEYLDILIDNLSQSKDVLFSVKQNHIPRTIAGETYLQVEFTVQNGGINLIQSYCVKKIDNIMVVIFAHGLSAEDCSELFDLIEEYK